MVVSNYFCWIVFVTVTIQVVEIAALSTIVTIPSTPDNIFVTGYSSLIVRAQLEKRSVMSTCAWNYGGDLDGLPWYSSIFGCDIPVNTRNETSETISCNESTINGTGFVISNLTLARPLTSDINVSVTFSAGTFTLLLYITVQDCPTSLAQSVIVKSNNPIYEAIGKFDCVNNGKLFYSNKTELSTTETTCIVSATWSGQDNLQCWIAPDVILNGNLTVFDGSSLNISCDYIDVTPAGNHSVYYFENAGAVRSKNERFISRKLQSEDNNKVISCQGVTPYTQIYNSSGRTESYTITVWYQPYQDSLTSCNWYINETGTCNVVFLANPNPRFVALTKNESVEIRNDGANIISSIKNEYFHFIFYKAKVVLNDRGNYKLILRSPKFIDDATISFTINVEKNHPTSTTNTCVSGPPSDLNSSLIAVGCIAGLLATAVIGLLLRLQQMSRLLAFKNTKAHEQDEAGYIEFQKRNRTESQQKNRNIESRLYVDMKAASGKDTNQAASFTSSLNQDILPNNEADYVVINPLSNENRSFVCEAYDDTSNGNEDIDSQKNKIIYENLKTASKKDRNYEIIS